MPLITLEQDHIDRIVDQVPGGVTNIQDIYPLGSLQEGILFHHMLSSKAVGDTYITPFFLSVPTREKADYFIEGLNKVVARHDVFRTAIFWEGLPQAVQVVLRDAQVVVNELHLDPDIDALSQLREHIAPGKLWMDLGLAPLLRADIASDPTSDKVFVMIYLK